MKHVLDEYVSNLSFSGSLVASNIPYCRAELGLDPMISYHSVFVREPPRSLDSHDAFLTCEAINQHRSWRDMSWRSTSQCIYDHGSSVARSIGPHFWYDVTHLFTFPVMHRHITVRPSDIDELWPPQYDQLPCSIVVTQGLCLTSSALKPAQQNSPSQPHFYNMYFLTPLIAALATLALANPFTEQQQGKGPRAEKCNSNVYNCLLTYYNFQPTSIQSYCTSFLSITTVTKTSTTVETSYDWINAQVSGGDVLIITGHRTRRRLLRRVLLLVLLMGRR
jgi:hypothetical protein